MEILFYGLVFIAGLFIGSFLNVVSDRVVNGKKLLLGRSECDECRTTLGSKDLVPLLSFISLRGKCRYCKAKLSYYYPISEILTGLVFVGIAHLLNFFENANNYYAWVMLAYLIFIGSVYIVLFLTDIKYTLIPNKVVYPAIAVIVLFLIGNFLYIVYSSYNSLQSDALGPYLIESGFWQLQMRRMFMGLVYTFISTVVIAGFFWVLTRIKNGEAMGGGDLKLAILIGLFNGYPRNILAIFLGFLFGAIASVLLMFLRRKGMKDTIPFGPFLILGSVIAFVFGNRLIELYWGLF